MDVNYAYYTSAKGFRVVGGTAAQFLKADGSVDSNIYLTSSDASKFFPKKNVVATTTDLNDLALEGVYYGYQWVNAPTTTQIVIAIVIVKRYSPDWIRQEFNRIDGSGITYVRDRYNGTTWGDWKIVADRDWVSANHLQLAGGTMSGGITFNGFSAGRIIKNLSTLTGGFSRNILELTATNGLQDSFGYFGNNDASGNTTLNYGYLGGTAYNTKNALRWTPDGRVGIGLTSSNVPQTGYSLHTAGNTYTVGNMDFTGIINSTTGELTIQRQGVNIIRTGGTNGDSVILSGKGGAVYFRPQGDAINTGEVYINNSGTIITQNHGNSSQWYSVSQAFIANPFFSRNNIISNNVGNTSVTTLDAYLPNGGYISNYGVASWGGSDRPTGASYGGYIKYGDASGVGNNGLQFYYNNGHGGSDLHRLWFRTKNTTVGVTNWFEVATKEGIASQLGSYVTQASLNTQLGNYATLNGVQAFTNTITFNESPLIPWGTLAYHAVTLGQLEDYVDNTSSSVLNQVSLNYIPNSHVVNGITSTDILNWNKAYNYGNHANAGYATETWCSNNFITLHSPQDVAAVKNFIVSPKVPSATDSDDAISLGQTEEVAQVRINDTFVEVIYKDSLTDLTFNFDNYRNAKVVTITCKGNNFNNIRIEEMPKSVTLKIINGSPSLSPVIYFDSGSIATGLGNATWAEFYRDQDGDIFKNNVNGTNII